MDAGAKIAGNTLDYFNRARLYGGAPDIGAMEFGALQVECHPRFAAGSKRSIVGDGFSISPSGPIRPAASRR